MNRHTLTEENYFSRENQLKYMGSSQFKAFRQCEVMALAELTGEYRREQSTALLVGSYVDAHFSGTLDIFKAQNPAIFLKSGGLKSDYLQANYIIDRIERDEMFMAAMSGGKQQIMVGEIEGVPVKIKIDVVLPDRTVDLKIVKDFADVYVPDEGYQPFWKAWGYDIQGALYQEIRRQNEGGDIKPFGIAGATKEKPEPDIALMELPQSELNVALHEIRAYIAYYDGLKKGLYEPDGCGSCPVCRSRKKLKGWVML